jgi:23S rRNA pseudouridine1911/1915/1917 synthase
MDSYAVPATAKGQRLDHFVVQSMPGQAQSRSQVQRLILAGAVLVDGLPRPARYSLRGGERVSVDLPPPQAPSLQARDIPLDILFEDRDLIVVNKPAGMVTHPGAGHAQDTLVNALLHHVGPRLQAIQGSLRPGIVHRLDKDTSGCLVAAKSEAAFVELQRMIADREVTRLYAALAWGDPEADEGSIDAALGRGSDRRKMSVRLKGGKAALTHFRVKARWGLACELELKLETGRTHQIRAHLHSIGHAVVGDRDYGRTPSHLPAGLAQGLDQALRRQALHAQQLQFRHPLTRKALKLAAPLPKDYLAARKLLSAARKVKV